MNPNSCVKIRCGLLDIMENSYFSICVPMTPLSLYLLHDQTKCFEVFLCKTTSM